jgi:hypothetical protein
MEIPALPAPCENRGGGALGFGTRGLWNVDRTSRPHERETEKNADARKELRQQADFPLKSVHLEGNPAWNAAPRWSKSYPKIKPAA